jgi:MoCo/4Fe-4S cofactor protein with predicted Tat translocation signal
MNESQLPEYNSWKSFEELARDPALHERMQHEYPSDDDAPTPDTSGFSRRKFMGLMAASMAFAAAGCRRPEQQIVPYVRKPEYLIPGVANHFATSFQHGNFSAGLLVRSREGRPVKIEGNELDPISGGASSVLAQASLLALYDPDRMLRPVVNGSDSTPQNAITRMAAAIKDVTARGKGVRVIVGEHASPSLSKMLEDMQTHIPDCTVVSWPVISADGAAQANRELLGIDAVTVPELSLADVILGVEADFLGSDPEALYHIRNFSKRRKPSRSRPDMSRFYSVEASMTLTGSNADHRIRIKPSEFNEFLLALLHEMVVVRGRGAFGGSITAELARHANTRFSYLKRIADDLLSDRGLVMIGRHLPAETHALGVLANVVLGAYGPGKAIDPARALPFSNDRHNAVSRLKDELSRGDVGVLLFADANLAYAMPPAEFRALTSKVMYKFACSLYSDETAEQCSIFVPINHYLEAWGDSLSIDGSQSIVQPLVAPLNEDQPSLGEVLLRLVSTLRPDTRLPVTWYDYVRDRWQREVYPAIGGRSFSSFWEAALRSGTVATAPASRSMTFNASAALARLRQVEPSINAAFHCGVLPDYGLYDGRYANLGWLQELPDPVTKATWDNLAIMSKSTAASLGVKKDDVVRVTSSTGSIELPVFIQPGVADGAVFTHTGRGRSAGGRILDQVGRNAFLLMPPGATIGYVSVKMEKTGARHPIACTQEHHSLSGPELYGIDRSGIVREGTLSAFLRDPESLFKGELPVFGAPGQHDTPLSIMPEHDYSKGHHWGMSIDTSACVGCNACITACVAENNIPVVGKEQVLKGREMSWIRIDRYYVGDEENPDTLVQPMLCQHCENAPCENVCPVAATTHSPEGLNEMTYNRCVGTRYCSNNCPYKVRRFNFLNNHENEKEPLQFVYNPDVTVRMRGVMEKCTFCVQRINEAKYRAKNEGRDLVNDGEIVTACQQACPAEAITFGNLNDPKSAVSVQQQSERGYLVLRELNTRPSITYLAKIRNTTGGKA